MATPKRKFTPSGRTLSDMPPDQRSAQALEFIAHYLDRIDDHLEQLVDRRGEDAKIAMALQGILSLLVDRLPGR